MSFHRQAFFIPQTQQDTYTDILLCSVKCGLCVVCVIFLRLVSLLPGSGWFALHCSVRTARFSFPTRNRFLISSAN